MEPVNHNEIESKPVVLLVDDQPRNLQLLGNSLNSLGYDIAVATSGTEALDLVEKARPYLVLLDVMMPEMDGFEVCRVLQERYGEEAPSVIFVTARTESRDILRGFALGAVDYITKPIEVAEVKARVRNHLDLRIAKDRLERVNGTLARINEQQRFFLSILSHDLRAPLASVATFLDHLMGEVREHVTDDQYDGLETIHSSVETMSSLLEELLGWARLQHDGMRADHQAFHVSAFLRESLRYARSQAEAKGIELRVDCPTHCTASGDLRMLSTVMRNLLSNAVKFTPEDGVVTLEGRETEDRICLAVCDTGVGIAPDRISRLFQPERRDTTLGTRNERGSGLGLILCKSLLESQGTKLSVETAVGRGSRFWFTLPKVTES